MLSATPTAILFPGQGSHTPGMRDLVAAVRPDLLDAVTLLVGEDPFERLEDSTRFAQPAIFCASLASWTRLQGQVEPLALAGHSLGELTALAAAGALDEHDALALVVERGRLMAEAGEAAESAGGTMLALLGATPALARKLAALHAVTVANDNAPGQAVLSGAPANLMAVSDAARAQGLRTLPLDVAGAFHSPQMQPAVEPFAAALAQVSFRSPKLPVISCATAVPFTDPATELAQALVKPVRWRETMASLAEVSAQAFIDVGPGSVLARLAKRCIPGCGTATAETLSGGSGCCSSLNSVRGLMRPLRSRPHNFALRVRRPLRCCQVTRTAGIVAVGTALPEQVIENAPIAARIGVEPEWITRRTGIARRRQLAEGERITDLCIDAGRAALANADVDGAELDAVLVATSTADELLPHCAPQVAAALGASHAMAWDIGLACTGFIAGLAQAAALVESGRADRVLLIGADAWTRHLDRDDKRTAMLFGDGAGAVVIEAGGAGRIGATVLGADTHEAEALTVNHTDRLIRMDGHTVFQHAVARMGQACAEVLERAGLPLAEVDLIVAHQANARIIGALRNRLDLPPERIVDYIADVGNTSAASIPLALERAAQDGLVPERGHVLLVAFGAGFAWGATLVEY